MRRFLALSCLLVVGNALAGDVPQSLAGDLTRKRTTSEAAGPAALSKDTFQRSVQSQLAAKRRAQIDDLQGIIALTPKDNPELAAQLFQLGELYQEASKQGEEGATQKAIAQYTEVIQNHPQFARMDEVLYFLARSLLDAGQDTKAIVALNRLIAKYPTSRYLADAYFARGEYYFERSGGKRELLEKALEAYQFAAKDPRSQIHEMALYKAGWCSFNLGDYHGAMDRFGEVAVLDRGAQ
jgi:tetratricopeptide (TPR) repeat protein